MVQVALEGLVPSDLQVPPAPVESRASLDLRESRELQVILEQQDRLEVQVAQDPPVRWVLLERPE